MATIRNFIFLLVAIFVGFLGIKFSAYGLMVNLMDSSLHEISINDINSENLKTKRYIKITDGFSIDLPLEYVDDRGNTEYYLYPLLNSKTFNDTTFSTKTNIVIESKHKINNWNDAEIKGLLEPYWYRIDEIVIEEFNLRGFDVDKDGYYLELDSKPLKWYWYLLILSIAFLFFYRMIEAIIKGVKSKKKKE